MSGEWTSKEEAGLIPQLRERSAGPSGPSCGAGSSDVRCPPPFFSWALVPSGLSAFSLRIFSVASSLRFSPVLFFPLSSTLDPSLIPFGETVTAGGDVASPLGSLGHLATGQP